MLQILITRNWRKADYTIGKLYVNGKQLCNTLEDTDRGLHSNMSAAQLAKLKVKGKTAIPTGTYKVEVTDSPKFQRPLPLLLNVPGFSGIRIHRGSTADSTEGCIIPGINNAVGRVSDSAKYEVELTKMIKADPDTYLTII